MSRSDLLFVAFLLSCFFAFSMAFPAGWTRRCSITIPASGVGSGGVSDFTVLLTETALPSEVFTIANSDGSDVRFSRDDAGTSPLTVDVIAWDADADTCVLRVGMLDLSSVADNTIYVWYGNSSATAQTGSGAYDQYWAGYWPLGGGADRTASGNDGTAEGGVTVGGASGTAGAATEFDGSDDHIDLGPATDLIFNRDFSLFARAKRTSSSFLAILSHVAYQWGYVLDEMGRVKFGKSQVVDLLFGSTTTNPGDWHSAGVTVDASGAATAWLDGTSDGTVDVSAYDFSDQTYGYNAQIGADESTGGSFFYGVGLLQHISAHSTARSAAWQTTEHAQLDAPSTFAAAGTPEDAGTGGGDDEGTTIFRRSLYWRCGARGIAA